MPHRTHRRRTATTAVVVAGSTAWEAVSRPSPRPLPALADVPVGEAFVSDLPWLNESNG